jgi:hypothetical protein
MKYKKINKEMVFQFMKTNRYTIDFYEVLYSARLIAQLLKTSVYQARKCLRQLKDEYKIEYQCQVHHDYGEYGKIEYTYPPICGYSVRKIFLSEGCKEGANDSEQS